MLQKRAPTQNCLHENAQKTFAQRKQRREKNHLGGNQLSFEPGSHRAPGLVLPCSPSWTNSPPYGAVWRITVELDSVSVQKQGIKSTHGRIGSVQLISDLQHMLQSSSYRPDMNILTVGFISSTSWRGRFRTKFEHLSSLSALVVL